MQLAAGPGTTPYPQKDATPVHNPIMDSPVLYLALAVAGVTAPS